MFFHEFQSQVFDWIVSDEPKKMKKQKTEDNNGIWEEGDWVL